MKRTQVVLWLAIVVMFLGCEGNFTQPDLSHQQDIELGQGELARPVRAVIKLDDDIQDSTVYVLPDDTTTTYVATGGELLPGGARVDNLDSQFYNVHLYSDMTVTFTGLPTVTLDSPTNLQYLDSAGTWITLTSSGTISPRAIRTGNLGSGTLTLNTLASVEEFDEENQN